VSAIYSTFFTAATDPAHNIRYDPALGGGALWDVGSYCVSLSTLIGGAPTTVAGVATMGPTGVDVAYSGTLGFAGGHVAQFACGIESALRTEVIVTGSERTLTMRNPWLPDIPADIWNGPAPAPGFEIHRGVEIAHTVVTGANPYGLQARNFAAAVRGDAEIVPSRGETVRTIATIEQLQAHTTLIEPAADVNAR
jgi:predicted dehydrogenase